MATLSPDQLLEAFESLTLLEVKEFNDKFQERFGVTAAAPVAAAAPAAAGAAGAAEAPAAAEEQTELTATLTEIGSRWTAVLQRAAVLRFHQTVSLGRARPLALLRGVWTAGARAVTMPAQSGVIGQRHGSRPLDRAGGCIRIRPFDTRRNRGILLLL
jgi:large subunit ribosomal protein L7/L12